MSTVVDNRVVQMDFDNRNFEKNVQTSMSTLEKLKQSLNLTGAAKGIEEIDKASRGFNLSGMTNAAENVVARFSYMQMTIQHQLNRIVDSAVNTGKRIASALTIDPITTGFQEYETQINAVQTILANTSSKGTTLQDVNSALDTLNTYADKTIYNFTEMTRNIGTFTAAGVDLDKSVSAIQGIANLAAVSGSSSQQASTAMYQLSQALAAGKVNLMDWNSVVNAGMGGQVFQDALKRTSEVMGTGAEKAIKTYGSFRESLSRGNWLTTDVLTKTLEQFTMAAEEGTEMWETYKASLMDEGYTEKQALEILKMANTATDAATKVKTFSQLWDTLKESAQSGWTQTWEIIMGDFGEAKEFLTKISDTIGGMLGASAESRNAILSSGLSTGWKQLLNAGIADENGYIDTLKTVAKDHGVSIDDMIAAEKKLDQTLTEEDAFQKVLKKGLSDGTLNADMFSKAVSSLADKMSKMSAKEREAAGYTAEYVEEIKKLDKGLKDGSISMDDFVKKMTRPSGRENLIEALWNSFNGLMSVVKPIKEAFDEIFPAMSGEQLYKITETLKEFTSKLTLSGENAEKLKTTFKGVFSVLDIGWTFIKELAGGIFDIIGHLTGFTGGILDITSAIGSWLINLRGSIKDGNLFGKTIKFIVDIIGQGIDAITNFGSKLKDSFKTDKYEGFVGFCKGILEFISQIGSGLGAALGNLGKAIANIFGKNSFGDVLESSGLAILGVGLYKLISNLNSPFEALTNIFDAFFGKESVFNEGGIFTNVKGIFNDVRECMEAYQNQLEAATLVKIAQAIAILAGAIFVISTIDPEALGKSLGAITLMFGELVASLALFTKIVPSLKTSLVVPMMISLATSLLILGAALKIISSMSWNELAKGLTGVGVGITILMMAIDFMPDRKVNKAAGTIRSLSISLIILGAALKVMGSMSWGELGRGLMGMAVGLGLMVAALNLMPRNWSTTIKGFGKITSDTSLISAGITFIALASAMKILASAVEDFGQLGWTELAKGLGAIAVSLLIFVGAIRSLPKNILGNLSGNMLSIGIGMMAMATAMIILSKALQEFASMSWTELAKGLVALGASMFILSKGLQSMTASLAGSAALLVATASLAMLAPVLKILGGMSWESIGKGLIAIAGAFVIFGIAGAILGPMVPTLLALSGAFALFGISVAAIGAGLTLIGIGISSIAGSLAVGAASIVASLTVIIAGLLDLVPMIITKFGDAILALCKVIGDCAPQIADTALKLISEVLKSLATYVPIIADSLFELLIGVLDVLSARMPELVVSAVKVISAFFQGVVDALSTVDTKSLLQGAIAVGLLTGLMYALSGVAALVPGAMTGVIGLGIVIAELALVLAAIGALAQIPGLTWLMEEGGNFLQVIGTAIGQFIGGIVGGVAKGATSTLPEVGTNLSTFMTNVQPFIDGAKTIDTGILDGVKTLTEAVLMLTGADIVSSLASFITGGNSLEDFGKQLVPFGESMKAYGQAVAGIDAGAIMASATAAKALATVADSIPNSGGLVSLFSGGNDISDFGEQLVPFGESMKAYSLAVAGIDAGNIVASAAAAKALADMANIIPNQGGMVAWLTGDNSLAKFSTELLSLGVGLKGFAMATVGISPEGIVACSTAAKSIADMMNVIPNQGGMVAWFTGDNSLAKFSSELISLGTGLKGFAIATTGIAPDSIVACANAAKSIADMMNVIPNQGGLAAWLTGDNSIANFGGDLLALGLGLQNFSIATANIVPENIVAAANAAKSLAEMTNVIPNSGGMQAWFVGDNSIARFAWQLPILGMGLAGFSMSVAGIVPENIVAAANAAKSLADMANVIPNEGGIKAWFVGDNSVARFASQLPLLGYGLSMLSVAVAGIVPENITGAANAAKTLAQMTNVIPNEGGMKAWFVGDNSVAKFADQLPSLGDGLKGFSDAVTGIIPENIVAAANAAKTLAQMTNVIPNEGGMKAWFTGDASISSFGDQLPKLGEGLKGFSDAVTGIVPENITAASQSAKSLAEMANTAPKNSVNLTTFGTNLETFGGKLKSYFEKVGGITTESITTSKNAIESVKTASTGLNASTMSSVSDAIDKLVKSLKGMAGITEKTTAGFVAALKKLANTSVTSIIEEFDGAGSKMTEAGTNTIQKFIDGVESQHDNITEAGIAVVTKFIEAIPKQEKKVKTTCTNLVNACVIAIGNSSNKFYNAGVNLVKGFANGISANTYLAKAKAKAMANAAADAARKALNEHSPSRVFYSIGDYAGLGFVNALADYVKTAYRAGSEMASSARDGLNNAVGKVTDLFNGDMDFNPTITPVLDLSNIKSGASSIGKIFGTPSVGVMSNLGRISTLVNSRNQNGGNDDVVDAINKLQRAMGNGGDTYNVNGITYDDGSAVSDAVKALIRTARIERRV